MPVAAAGNEFAEGNPLEFPASLPHVLTVAAVGPDLQPSYFSNANAAIDLSAPGESIMTAVPPAHDGDGVADGYERQNGTSFAAPMVAAAVAWVRAARPELTADQVNQAVRLSARDVGPRRLGARQRLRRAVGRPRADDPAGPGRSLGAERRHRSGSTGARSAGPTACCTPAAAVRG